MQQYSFSFDDANSAGALLVLASLAMLGLGMARDCGGGHGRAGLCAPLFYKSGQFADA
ncbi:hypothetical protein RE432_00805 [Pusillimonas sp. SM2304]|uniref:hypothetical protein n=1 Tax=Pusillimonas sp. SM2304 TaxID=3073241 RepID=UPI002875881C|nr:hypothetical protein [Pusillimonas sp. SM2304]MDS1138954.1 hypothetical protein [Pusillimonas sp. SM2304]